ncbi:MAG: hypothetical protein ACLGI6_14890 [Gammaproteobacteria bacterium]
MRRLMMLCSAMFLLGGCASLSTFAPFPRELPHASGDILAPSAQAGMAKVVFLNEYPRIYRRDPGLMNWDFAHREMGRKMGGGVIKVMVDGKSLEQINIGEYASTVLPYGTHAITLIRKDMVELTSKHELLVEQPHQLVLIFESGMGSALETTAADRGLDGFQSVDRPVGR